MENIERAQIMQIFDSQKAKGTFFSVDFIKQSGESRKLTGRLGVKKHLKNGKNTTKGISKYLTVFDIKVGNFRNVNLETITHIKANGREYNIV
jgi:hypothetical protein